MPLHEMMLGSRASVVARKAQFLLHRGCPRTAREPQGNETKTKASPNGSSRLAFRRPPASGYVNLLCSFLFRFLRSLRFRGLFPVTSNHYHRQERSHHRRREQRKDNRYSDRPDSGQEESLEWMIIVDEGLLRPGELTISEIRSVPTMSSVQTV